MTTQPPPPQRLATQPPPPTRPGRSHVPTPDRKQPVALILLVTMTSLFRFGPLLVLSFYAIYGLAGLSSSERNLYDAGEIYTFTAIVAVGSLLVCAQIILAMMVRLRGLRVVAGLLALADLAAMFWIPATVDNGGGELAAAAGVTLVVQLLLVGWITKTMRSGETAVSPNPG